MRYRFSNCVFDAEAFELTRKGERVDTTPQVLSILNFLLVSRQRLVTKDELVAEVWGGRSISDAAISVRLRALREAIGDTGTKQRLVKTIRGRGLRFVGEVTTETASKPPALPEVNEPADDHTIAAEHRLDSRPTVAVLPFVFAGEVDDYAILRFAVPDELLTELSKLRWLFVIARGSSFQFQSHHTRPHEVKEILKAQYCVSGSIEVSGTGLVVSVELAETASENVIWRDRRRIDLQEIHEFRGELVKSIGQQLGKSIEQHQLTMAMLTPAISLDSWQSLHMGMHHLNTSPVEHYHEAKKSFHQSLELDPNFARAHAGLSQVQFFRLHWGNSENPPVLAEGCIEAARQALSEDPFDPFCNLAMGRSSVLARDYGAWRAHVERAIQISPSYSLAFADLARIQAVAGELDESRRTLEIVERLDPHAAHPESLELTRLILEFSTDGITAAAPHAAKMATSENLGLNTYCSVLVTLYLGGLQTEADQLAARLKQKFLPARLQEWFQTEVLRHPELIKAAKKVGEIYAFD